MLKGALGFMVGGVEWRRDLAPIRLGVSREALYLEMQNRISKCNEYICTLLKRSCSFCGQYMQTLVDHTVFFQRLYTFVNTLTNFGNNFINNLLFLDTKVDGVVAGNQQDINDFSYYLDADGHRIRENEQIGQTLKVDIDNFRKQVEQQLRDFANQGILPDDLLRTALRNYTGEQWRYLKQHGGCSGTSIANPVPPPTTLAINADVINVIATDNQYVWSLTASNVIAVILNNLIVIQEALPKANSFSIRGAVAKASADSGILLRVRLRNAQNNCGDLMEFLKLDLIDYNTDVKMRGCW
jgi:hypothetical protein